MIVKTVLIADDDSAIRTVVGQALTRAGYAVRSTATAAGLWRWVSEGQGDVVITDVVLPDESGFDLLPRIKKFRPSLPVIVMSAKNTIMTAITAAERGAYDYLPKPFDLNALVSLVGRAGEQMARPANDSAAPAENLPIIGHSPSMQEIYRIIARLTQTALTVMIVGESGTGKELVARALHDYGKRRRGPFVAVNMAAIPRELIEMRTLRPREGRLYRRSQRMAGRFEQAEGGTLFLDEIGDMPLEAQTRLLRVLQQGEYTTVGGTAPIKTNVRIVAATHRDLRQLIDEGIFREDLYFRLNVVPIRIPRPAGTRRRHSRLGAAFPRACPERGLAAQGHLGRGMESIKSHRWPGNVRELENFIRRIAAIYVEETITPGIVARELTTLPSARPPIWRTFGPRFARRVHRERSAPPISQVFRRASAARPL